MGDVNHPADFTINAGSHGTKKVSIFCFCNTNTVKGRNIFDLYNGSCIPGDDEGQIT